MSAYDKTVDAEEDIENEISVKIIDAIKKYISTLSEEKVKSFMDISSLVTSVVQTYEVIDGHSNIKIKNRESFKAYIQNNNVKYLFIRSVEMDEHTGMIRMLTADKLLKYMDKDDLEWLNDALCELVIPFNLCNIDVFDTDGVGYYIDCMDIIRGEIDGVIQGILYESDEKLKAELKDAFSKVCDELEYLYEFLIADNEFRACTNEKKRRAYREEASFMYTEDGEVCNKYANIYRVLGLSNIKEYRERVNSIKFEYNYTFEKAWEYIKANGLVIK